MVVSAVWNAQQPAFHWSLRSLSRSPRELALLTVGLPHWKLEGPAGVKAHSQARPAVGPQFLSCQRQRQWALARQLGLDAPPARGAVSTRRAAPEGPCGRWGPSVGSARGFSGFSRTSPSPPSAIAVTAGMRPGPPGAATRRRGAGPNAAATARRPWGDPRIRKKRQRSAGEAPGAIGSDCCMIFSGLASTMPRAAVYALGHLTSHHCLTASLNHNRPSSSSSSDPFFFFLPPLLGGGAW